MKKDKFRTEPDGVVYGGPPIKKKKSGCVTLVAGTLFIGAGFTTMCTSSCDEVQGVMYGPPPVEDMNGNDSVGDAKEAYEQSVRDTFIGLEQVSESE